MSTRITSVFGFLVLPKSRANGRGADLLRWRCAARHSPMQNTYTLLFGVQTVRTLSLYEMRMRMRMRMRWVLGSGFGVGSRVALGGRRLGWLQSNALSRHVLLSVRGERPPFRAYIASPAHLELRDLCIIGHSGVVLDEPDGPRVPPPCCGAQQMAAITCLNAGPPAGSMAGRRARNPAGMLQRSYLFLLTLFSRPVPSCKLQRGGALGGGAPARADWLDEPNKNEGVKRKAGDIAPASGEQSQDRQGFASSVIAWVMRPAWS